MKVILIILFSIFYSHSSFAKGECDWAKETPSENSKYQYFVAREYSKNIDDAQNKAERDIDSQISRLLGSEFITQSDYYQDERLSSGTTRTKEYSIGSIVLKGLEKQRSNTEKNDGGYFACVQYRYDKKEIEKERIRLNNKILAKNEKIIYDEVEGNRSCRGSVVFINTRPKGAFVTLNDGEYQGYSPIKFGNVCNGKYNLKITKENYKEVEELLIVNSIKNIDKTLTIDSKNIKITTNLGNSNIFIDNVDRGKEPIILKAEYNKEYIIEATNSESYPILRRVRFYKYSEPNYIFNLERKPANIDFSAFKTRNKDVNVYVDGKKLNDNKIFGLKPGKHKLTFRKKNYKDIVSSVNLKGGETIYYRSNVLNFKKEEPVKFRMGPISFGISSKVNHQSITKNIGFYMDILPLELKIGMLYLRASIFGDIIFFKNGINETKLKYSYSYGNRKYYSKEIKEFSSYIDMFNFNFGLNLTNKISVYGISKIGQISYEPSYQGTESEKIIFRFGIGAQYDLNDYFALRLDYSTGSFKTSSDFIINNKITNIKEKQKIDTLSLIFSIIFSS